MGAGKHTQEDFNDEMNDLEMGMEKEQETREFYRQAAEQCSDARVQALFHWFVGAATARIAALEAVRVSAAGTQAWAPEIGDQIRAADATAGPPPVFDTDNGGKPGRAEITTLRQAIELEKEVASIYFTAAQRSRESNIRAFYRYLGPVEEGHKQLLESYFDDCMRLAIKKK
jgi:rubrerythrin